jgi:formate dehydrogenase accessory protein FdhD
MPTPRSKLVPIAAASDAAEPPPSSSRRTAAKLVPQSTAVETVERDLPEETPVALVFNGVSHAVMLATPADLEDFALGFALSEGIIGKRQEMLEVEIVSLSDGIEARVTLLARQFAALKERRRALAGPTGCGLCGMESLDDVLRPLPKVAADFTIAASALRRALAEMPQHQVLNRATGAVHAAAWADGAGKIVLLREDVGRHNALDKLIGALAARDIDPSHGALLLTSRLSFELVQKAAMAGMPVMMAVSAPTARAIRLAEQAGITAIGLARADSMLAFTHTQRLVP